LPPHQRIADGFDVIIAVQLKQHPYGALKPLYSHDQPIFKQPQQRRGLLARDLKCQHITEVSTIRTGSSQTTESGSEKLNINVLQ
jgi:hypothetical protein